MSTHDDSTALHVLLIDDDRELAGLLSARFDREGIQLAHAANAAAGLEALARSPALVLLDLMLPDLPGIELFRRMRERAPGLPVIMLTAKGAQVDRVVGLELGADDYVAKPFDPRELVARIRAVLRRAPPAVREPVPDDTMRQTFGQVVLDLRARRVSLGERGVELTAIEFKLLVELARQPDMPVSREALTAAMRSGGQPARERAVDVQVARLRRKLHALDPSAAWVLTARGEGYVWAPPGAS